MAFQKRNPTCAMKVANDMQIMAIKIKYRTHTVYALLLHIVAYENPILEWHEHIFRCFPLFRKWFSLCDPEKICILAMHSALEPIIFWSSSVKNHSTFFIVFNWLGVCENSTFLFQSEFVALFLVQFIKFCVFSVMKICLNNLVIPFFQMCFD